MFDQQIIHRDIKLENIFLSHDAEATHPDTEDITFKYGDLGFARYLDFNEASTWRCGTPRYLAPEILFRSSEQYKHGPDMWAIGVVLYRCLTGVFPFTDEDITNIVSFDAKLSKLCGLFPVGTNE